MSKLKKLYELAKLGLGRLMSVRQKRQERIRGLLQAPADEDICRMPEGFGNSGRARFLAREIERELKSHELTSAQRRELTVALNLVRFLGEKGAPVPASVDELVRLSRGLEECLCVDAGKDMGELVLSDRMLTFAARGEKPEMKN